MAMAVSSSLTPIFDGSQDRLPRQSTFIDVECFPDIRKRHRSFLPSVDVFDPLR
jgi:hypothetical protein